jgi:AcrR family transcriptional regulator
VPGEDPKLMSVIPEDWAVLPQPGVLRVRIEVEAAVEDIDIAGWAGLGWHGGSPPAGSIADHTLSISVTSDEVPYPGHMRRHGWGGDIPSNDQEARARIVAASQQLLREEPDQAPTISEVAERLSVSRQTIYRYFPSSHALLVASVSDGIDEFLDAIATHLRRVRNAADAVVEGIAFTYEQIYKRPDLALLISSNIGAANEITSAAALTLGRSILDRLAVDWEAAGFDSGTLDELIELMLRTLQSFIVDPGDPQRSPQQLRGYLRRWVGPAVTARSG